MADTIRYRRLDNNGTDPGPLEDLIDTDGNRYTVGPNNTVVIPAPGATLLPPRITVDSDEQPARI